MRDHLQPRGLVVNRRTFLKAPEAWERGVERRYEHESRPAPNLLLGVSGRLIALAAKGTRLRMVMISYRPMNSKTSTVN